MPTRTLAFSAKTEYGVVALIELAGVHPSGGVLQVSEIAGRQSIPERYLEQMLTSLRKAGILRSIRGPKGGYQLMRAPAEIPMSEVVACLEGEASPRETAKRHSIEFDVLDQIAARLEVQRQNLLASTSLQDLLDQRDARLQTQAMYFI